MNTKSKGEKQWPDERISTSTSVTKDLLAAIHWFRESKYMAEIITTEIVEDVKDNAN